MKKKRQFSVAVLLNTRIYNQVTSNPYVWSVLTSFCVHSLQHFIPVHVHFHIAQLHWHQSYLPPACFVPTFAAASHNSMYYTFEINMFRFGQFFSIKNPHAGVEIQLLCSWDGLKMPRTKRGMVQDGLETPVMALWPFLLLCFHGKCLYTF